MANNIETIESILTGQDKTTEALAPVKDIVTELKGQELENASEKIWIASRDGTLCRCGFGYS